jgi:hypothetical protein
MPTPWPIWSFGRRDCGQTFVAESLADGHALTPGYSAALDDDGDLRDVSHRYHPGWVAHWVAISTRARPCRAMEHLLTGGCSTSHRWRRC